MNDWTDITINDLNKSQRRGAMRVINQMNDKAERSTKYGAGLELELKQHGSLISIIVRINLHDLGEGNPLRYLEERDYYHAFIGQRGAVNAVTYPKSCDQFKGTRTFGINYK